MTIQNILGNQLISIYESNWYFLADSKEYSPIYTQSRSYGKIKHCFQFGKKVFVYLNLGNCSCSSVESLYCTDPLVINGNVSIPGMFIGCLPITSLRLSTLQCFYDQHCLDIVKDTLGLNNISITALNSTQSSRFLYNTTLDRIINNLMLEEWSNSQNYSAYFYQCNPQQCSYSIVRRNDASLILTTLLGFCKLKSNFVSLISLLYSSIDGGLIVALKFIAPILIRIFRKVNTGCQRNRRIIPQLF